METIIFFIAAAIIVAFALYSLRDKDRKRPEKPDEDERWYKDP